MIENKLKAVVCALTIGGAAIANAGCNTEDGLTHPNVDAGPIVRYAAASDIASDAEPGVKPGEAASATAQAANTEYPTPAEARHFAVYNHYRAMVESSGSSGPDSQMHCGGDAQNTPIPTGGLLGAEYSVCPGDASGK